MVSSIKMLATFVTISYYVDCITHLIHCLDHSIITYFASNICNLLWDFSGDLINQRLFVMETTAWWGSVMSKEMIAHHANFYRKTGLEAHSRDVQLRHGTLDQACRRK